MRVCLLMVLVWAWLALHSTQVVFINNIPYADSASVNDFSMHLFTQLSTILEEDFTYQYTTWEQAATMLDEGQDVVVFPYAKPRFLSNRILLSDTLFVAKHKIFYNSVRHPDLTLKDINDIVGYTIGSAVSYKHETRLRRFGFNITYSLSNLENLQRLVDGVVDFVVEDRLQGIRYSQDVEGGGAIVYADADIFFDVYYAIVPVRNAEAVGVLNKINELVRSGVVEEIVEGYFGVRSEELLRKK